MQIDRLYTVAGQEIFAEADFRIHQSEDGTNYIVPRKWQSAAIDVLLDRVFFKGDIPAGLSRQRDPAVPEFLWPAMGAEEGGALARETDIRRVLWRVAGGLAYAAARAGLFDAPQDAESFYDELRYMLFYQVATLESALWRSGLDWAYGLTPAALAPQERIAALPQDFSPRAMPLSGVSVSPGDPRRDILKRVRLLAEIDMLQNGAGPLAVMLPIEHADSPAFIQDRKQGDIDAVARNLGIGLLKTAMHHVMDATDRGGVFGYDPAYNVRLKRALDDARASGAPEGALQRAIELARQGQESVALGAAEEESEFRPFITPVVSVPDDFIETALTGHGFMMVDAGKASYHAPAPELLAQLSDAVWSSGAPEIFFRGSASAFAVLGDDAVLGRSASGGFIFLPETEAPSATLNLMSFAAPAPATLDLKSFEHAVAVALVALEASLGAASLSPRTQRYRPVCLGLGNLASFLMASGRAYDSGEGRSMAALLSAALSGAAHHASARMADSIGAFDRYATVSKDYLQSIKARMNALGGTGTVLPGLTRRPPPLNAAQAQDDALLNGVRRLWDRAYGLGKEQGFRHAHLTSQATGIETQALLGIETRDLWPENALVRFEGYFADREGAAIYGKKMNPAVPRALLRLGYAAAEIDDMHVYAVGHGTLLGAPGINHDTLAAKGFSPEALARLDAALQNAQQLRYVFNEWTLGEGAQSLEALGFSEDDIDAASLYACGAMTLEGAPHLKPAHLAIFDCQRASAPGAVRAVTAEAQVAMQAAVEPFLSGAAAHVLALHHHAGIDDVQKLILKAWELGLKGLRIYREASSLQHPLAVPETLESLPAEPATSEKPLKQAAKILK